MRWGNGKQLQIIDMLLILNDVRQWFGQDELTNLNLDLPDAGNAQIQRVLEIVQGRICRSRKSGRIVCPSEERVRVKQ